MPGDAKQCQLFGTGRLYVLGKGRIIAGLALLLRRQCTAPRTARNAAILDQCPTLSRPFAPVPWLTNRHLQSLLYVVYSATAMVPAPWDFCVRNTFGNTSSGTSGSIDHNNFFAFLPRLRFPHLHLSKTLKYSYGYI